MPKIAFVTDSTSFLPAELIKKHNITVTPQLLIWGEGCLALAIAN
jgi:fatty acid-binding protein DegV